MLKNVTLRIVIIAAILVISFVSLYPVKDWKEIDTFKGFPPTINLGLDLQGGMHLIIQVNTKYIENLAAKDKTVDVKQYTKDAVEKTLEIIRNRIDQFGVAEPSIKRLANDRIEIELPGLRDPQRARKLIEGQAVLEFKMVHKENDMLIKEITDEKGDLLPGKIVPADYKILYEYPKTQEGFPVMLEDGKTPKKIPYLISNKVELRGDDLRTADVNINQENKPIISFKLKPNAAVTFENLTDRYRERSQTDNNRLAIVLDNNVLMAPHIKSRIPGGEGIIEGGFNLDEAKNIAIKLRSGALPVPIDILEEQTVGPSLGADSIQKGIKAAYIGSVGVVLFMILYYLAFGIIADIALILNIFMMLGCMAFLGATLTLPGIAGIALTIGMAVDANVIIFERIKEEMRLGKKMRGAIETGYSKAFITIADANITTLIIAIVLYQYGAGPIRGFAVTLTLGILCSMFAGIFITRTMLIILLNNNNISNIPVFSPLAILLDKCLPTAKK
ncbi:protein translocase subunit SecD [Candidatus Dependentiae bacterium]|nr:protein translocase subunit SecD [Candidatus Dependentiae bacterium]